MFERKIVKMCTSAKYGENWRIGTNKEIKRHSTRSRYCKSYEVPPNEMVWSCREEIKTTHTKPNCDSNVCKEHGIEENHVKDGGTRVNRILTFM
jgi:hypothetical protein